MGSPPSPRLNPSPTLPDRVEELRAWNARFRKANFVDEELVSLVNRFSQLMMDRQLGKRSAEITDDTTNLFNDVSVFVRVCPLHRGYWRYYLASP